MACSGFMRGLPKKTPPVRAPEALFGEVRGAVAPLERPRRKPLQTAANCLKRCFSFVAIQQALAENIQEMHKRASPCARAGTAASSVFNGGLFSSLTPKGCVQPYQS
eukprot:15458649-Alexandrium_andersonii.AAC.1